MGKYSITLNFFIPKELITIFKKLEFTEEVKYDWRKTGYAHCTVKALEIRNSEPSKSDILMWSKSANAALSKSESFIVSLKEINNFPKVVYAAVKSKRLIEIHNKLCKVLPSSRPQFEGKNYLPHVSLIETSLEINKEYIFDMNASEFFVKEIQLVSWDLENNHNPKILHRFKLK